MIGRIKVFTHTENLRGTALRGTIVVVFGAVGGHMLRFASNLILTRLLFPEAFGLMALVTVIIVGLTMISDFGPRTSVMQNPRGDEPDFLNTAWSIQVIRGVLLWLIVSILAAPISRIYGQPALAQILPVAGFGLVIEGFYTTNALSVQRHLNLGRYTILTLLSQTIHLVTIAVLAYYLKSVWALVLGLLIQPSVALLLYARFLPGIRNRFHLDGQSVREILTLGKYLFLSTIATYIIGQSDRTVLGLLVPIDILGIYGIGFALATLPPMLASAVSNSVVFPLYRMRHPSDAKSNQVRIFQARRLVTAAALGLSCALAFLGPWLVNLLYDARYGLAGPIIVVLCMANVPIIVLSGTMNAALVKGDSLRFMVINVATALCQILLLYFAVLSFGIVGAAASIGLAPLLTYPLLAVFLYRYRNWDVWGDAVLMSAGLALTGLASWLHFEKIVPLMF